MGAQVDRTEIVLSQGILHMEVQKGTSYQSPNISETRVMTIRSRRTRDNTERVFHHSTPVSGQGLNSTRIL